MSLILRALFVAGTLSACERHLVNDVPIWPEQDPAIVQAIIEIPAGTRAKWEVNATSGQLEWEKRDGEHRVINSSFPYLTNYGMIPQTYEDPAVGGDGDPLDIVVLGEAAERGATLPTRVIGVMRMRDGGEVDDKVIGVRLDDPRLGHLRSLEQAQKEFPELTPILQTWFSHYKQNEKVEIVGWEDIEVALETIRKTHRDYESKKK